MAITASYQVSADGLAARGMPRDATAGVLRRSVTVAQQARDSFEGGRQRWMAASVGPYGAALADGSEYHGDYGLTVEALRAWHRPRLEVLLDAGADLLALETIPCLAEAQALLEEFRGAGVPCWLSLTCEADRTRRGEPLREAFAMAADAPEVIAVGVNCCAATGVVGTVALAHHVSGKPVVCYPNSGELWDATARGWAGPLTFHPADAPAWVAAGARLVGGCCRVGPDEIRAVAAAIAP
ncbi:MAG TPA: homocysteine S-methyltransferase [Intrasporangium sp.]|uniref:homocysteine S-methyltransferase n=1 Tax=Intrasporangium sp. TaxID=1925024 RepID=UPI002B4899BD|nr:homocysteine S-methyltransferase [Intrasporangium sp.]HKX66600.1 homocysteine S-methyltransferase [Intrasporangium sp.]